jgi:exopolysaccharide biosynthesis polyprenyl glycosylphosphotransferase
MDSITGLVALIGSFVFANLDWMPEGLHDFLQLRITLKNVLLLLLFLVVWRLAFVMAGLYRQEYLAGGPGEAMRVIVAVGVCTLTALVFPLTTNTGAFHFSVLPQFWFVGAAGVVGTRWALRRVCAPMVPSVKQILIVGAGPRGVRVFRDLCGPDRKDSNFLGFVDSLDKVGPEVSSRLLGRLDELESVLMHRAVDEVLIALPTRSHWGEIEQAIAVCERVGVPTRFLADVFQRRAVVPQGSDQFLSPVVRTLPDDYRLIFKRCIDVTAALLGLVILAPFLLLISLLIATTSPGPVFFAQERYGLNRRRFKMYKFRTMVADAEQRQEALESLNEATGPVFKIRNDPRITTVGRVLRRTSMDELPQLVNVLKGEMSLVGPRPLPLRDVGRFTEAALMRRFSVPPGLTCLWQISGRSDVGFDDWIKLDLEYIDRWSLALDCRILILTLPAVVRGAGAS